MQKIMPLAQFTINLEWCASEAHTRGESLLRGHGANRIKCLFRKYQTSHAILLYSYLKVMFLLTDFNSLCNLKVSK